MMDGELVVRAVRTVRPARDLLLFFCEGMGRERGKSVKWGVGWWIGLRSEVQVSLASFLGDRRLSWARVVTGREPRGKSYKAI
jgi:hypothetical protein